MDDIINDEILGELEYQEVAWVGELETPVLNSDGKLTLVFHDDNKEGILDVQRDAYKTYLQNEEKYKNSVTDYLLEHYKWVNEYFMRTVSGIDESFHKDVVTEKQLYQAMGLWYLFICRDGSFGYAFGCCWDRDNGIAVLLSESEPRVISRTQLENLHKLNDPTVGLLVHDGKNAWKGLEVNKFFGKPENLEIELEGGVEEGITEAQQKAYADYLEKKEVHFASLTKLMLTAYLGDPALAEKSLNSDFKVVVASALPKTLFIDREGNYGWICYTSWNKSYLALHLSSENPTWMDPHELRTYASNTTKTFDKDFGTMFLELSNWRKFEVFHMNDWTITAPVYVASYGKEITDEQRAIYKDYLQNQAVYKKELVKTMHAYYKEYYEDFEEYVDLPEDADKNHISDEFLINLLDFTSLMINKHGKLAWLCEIPTENSGLALEWKNGKVKYGPLSAFIF